MIAPASPRHEFGQARLRLTRSASGARPGTTGQGVEHGPDGAAVGKGEHATSSAAMRLKPRPDAGLEPFYKFHPSVGALR